MKKKENNAILVVHAEAVCVSCEALTEAGGGSERSRGKCKREPLHGTRLAAKRRGPGHVLCRFSPCGKGHREVQEFKRQLNGTGERKKLVVVVV